MPLLRTGGLSGIVVGNRHKLANNVVLPGEGLLPALQGVHLAGSKTVERVQRAVQVLRQHVRVEAVAGQTAAGIATCKVGVRTAGAVEVAPVADVEDAAADGEEDGVAVFAVEGQQRSRGVGAEDLGRRAAGDRSRRVGAREGRDCRVDEDA